MKTRQRLALAGILMILALTMTLHFVRVGTQNPYTDGAMIYTISESLAENRHVGVIAVPGYKHRLTVAILGIAVPFAMLLIAGYVVWGLRKSN